MSYTVVRTDKMSGVKQPVDLLSVRFYDGNDKIADVENGVIAEVSGYEGDATNGYQREVRKAVAATSNSDLSKCVLLAAPELMHDERVRNLDEFINKAGKPIRGYILRSRNEFSVTKDGFVGGNVPAVGGNVGIGAGGKLDASGSGFGKCIHIETAGRYTYYEIEIGVVEA